MKPLQRYLLYSALGLFIIGIILLSSSRWMAGHKLGPASPGGQNADWQPFPTRPVNAIKYTATPSVAELLEAIHNEILVQDYNAASKHIEQAKMLFPENAAFALSEARLALMVRDYSRAENLIWEVIGTDPTNASHWVLASTILKANAKPDMADQALSMALKMNPDLASDLFPERWRIAINNGDAERLTELADAYYLLHPEDPLADYYTATALIASGHNSIALNHLVTRLTENPQSPAVVWFTLGKAYLNQNSYRESATAFENAQHLQSLGDQSLELLTGDADLLLMVNLAEAYLGSQRCVSAEALFRRLASETNDTAYEKWITDAVVCQTPTPTPTHWMLSLQTRTPTPN